MVGWWREMRLGRGTTILLSGLAGGAVLAGRAVGAPEMIVDGGAERGAAHAWVVEQGGVVRTGMVRDGRGGYLTPAEGLGFFDLVGPGFTVMTQTGVYPMGSERVVLRGWVRTNGVGAVQVRLRARDLSGAVVEERLLTAPSTTAWAPVRVGYEIPQGARTWEVTVTGVFGGALGLHVDGLAMVGTCLADLTGDRVLNFFDVSAFLSAFAGEEPDGDFTGNGVWDFFDVSDFLDYYSVACE